MLRYKKENHKSATFCDATSRRRRVVQLVHRIVDLCEAQTDNA